MFKTASYPGQVAVVQSLPIHPSWQLHSAVELRQIPLLLQEELSVHSKAEEQSILFHPE